MVQDGSENKLFFISINLVLVIFFIVLFTVLILFYGLFGYRFEPYYVTRLVIRQIAISNS